MLISGGYIGAPKRYTNMAPPYIQSSTKVRETFRQVTQKTGRFPVVVFCCVTVKTIYTSIGISCIKLNTDCICFGHLASNALSLQGNSQSERAQYCSRIIINPSTTALVLFVLYGTMHIFLPRPLLLSTQQQQQVYFKLRYYNL